jgi:oligopeptide/dipeptide ABC transporter ATP-binding protein
MEAAASGAPASVVKPTDQPLLEVTDLHTQFALRGSFAQRVRGRATGSVKAVDGVSFTLHRGEVLGVVGESGSGKTTLGRTLLGLATATGGSIKLEGREITGLSEAAFRPLRRRLQIVFQDPHASLNPAMTIGESVGHPLRIHGIARDREQVRTRVVEALERVGLHPAEQYMSKYPTDLSGGQKQRAVLARAIILGPDILIADEPVSMLDMSVRAKILELMIDLKRELDLTYVYITHDLATAKFFCDRIAIMYLGKIVEIGPAAEIYDNPRHPYTVSLLRAIPEPDPTRRVARDLPRGEVPDAVTPPLGCSFHPRCPRAFEVCGWESRDLRTLLEARWTRMPEPEYRAEREMIASLEPLDVPATSARLEPA